MFHQSFNPFVRLDIPLRMPKEISPRQRRKTLARRLREQDRALQRLSYAYEDLPPEMLLPKSNDVQEESSDRPDDSSCPHMLDEEDANDSLNSCPVTISASGPKDDGDLLDAPDSPLTYPPRTVMVRTVDPHAKSTPRTKNGLRRKRIFSTDFSTICFERGETSDAEQSLGEDDVSSVEDDHSASSFDHQDDDDEWEWDETATFGTAATYPPRLSIMLLPDNQLDVIATPHRSRTYRSYSDLSNSSFQEQISSRPPQPFPTLPKLKEAQLWAHDEFYGEPLYKVDLTDETDDDDDDQFIPHVMSCPDIFGDTEDEDDISDIPFDPETRAIIVHFIGSASCPPRLSTPGRLSTEGSIASTDM